MRLQQPSYRRSVNSWVLAQLAGDLGYQNYFLMSALAVIPGMLTISFCRQKMSKN
jgi:hypothetical protein